MIVDSILIVLLMTEPAKVKPKRASRAKKPVVAAIASINTSTTTTIVEPGPTFSPVQETVDSASASVENVQISIIQDTQLTSDVNELDKIKYIEDTVENIKTVEPVVNNDEVDDANSKKRGRKPKGGKIIQQMVSSSNNVDAKSTIILHLRCFMKDLKVQQENSIDFYNFSSGSCFGANSTPTAELCYSADNYTNKNVVESASIYINNTQNDQVDATTYSSEKDVDMKEIWKKLKQLEHSLHGNNVSDKKSACFWCTYDFDNPPIHIPKYFLKNSYHVYGCFCSPECSVAYLMNEKIDSSNKFERYHLLNHIYAKIYDYNKNIKPAPNPFYMLEKYYGNMTIQEYRALLRNERLFLIVDKPLTRIMPELHQDNEEHIINNRKVIPSNNQNAKKKVQRKVQSKSSIVNEKFGLASSAPASA